MIPQRSTVAVWYKCFAEALLHQFRYQAAVINMGVVRKRHAISSGSKGEIFKVAPAQGPPALEHAAVYKDFLFCLQKKTRARYRPGAPASL